MPGLIKIGRTTRSVEQRANELWQTGVPTPFVIEHYQLFPDCIVAEAEIHGAFLDQRSLDSREFFKVTVDEVVSEIEVNLQRAMAEIIAIYEPSCRLLSPDEASAYELIEECGQKIGVSPLMIALGIRERPRAQMWADIEAMQTRVAALISEDDAA